MKILCLVNEEKLFKGTYPVRTLFFSQEDKARLHALGDVIYVREEDVASIREEATLKEFRNILAQVDAIYEDEQWIPEDILADFPNVRCIAQIRGALPPYSRAFYRDALSRGVSFLSESPAYAPAVAELALGHTINLLRGISRYNDQMRRGEERFSYCLANTGDTSLYGKTVGILGFGRIGRTFRRLLAPFDCQVLAYDPFIGDDAAMACGVRRVALDRLLEASDVVVLMAMPHPDNEGILNARTLGLLRQGACVVNVARASLIDEAALVDWLRAGRGQAALDVFWHEPLARDSPLRGLPGLVLTPHRAGGIQDAYRRIGHNLVLDLEAVARGETPDHMLRLVFQTLDLYVR